MTKKQRPALTPYVKKSRREATALSKRTTDLATSDPPVFLQPGHVLFFHTPDPGGKRVEMLPGDGITLRNENGHLSIAYHSGSQVVVVGRFPIGPTSIFEMLVSLGWGHNELPVNEAAKGIQTSPTKKPDVSQADLADMFTGTSDVCPICRQPLGKKAT